MRALPFLALVIVCAASSARAQQADPPPAPSLGVTLVVTPLALPAGVDAPGDPRYLYRVSLGLEGILSVEVVTDRRLLSLEVQEPGARRPVRCADPTAPRFVRHGLRVQRLAAVGARVGGPGASGDEAPPGTWTEWVDLREYCSGRALAALDRGARVVPHYGFARGPRDAWVARTIPAGGAEPRSAKELVGAAFDVAPRAVTPVAGDARVTLAPVDRSTQDGVSLRVSVRSAGPARRIYLRSDQIGFRVRSALGTHECGLPHEVHGTVADFFTRIDARRATTLTLEARIVCHDAFPLAGIYEVTPLVTLPYRAPDVGGRHGPESLTGNFRGEPAVVRIRQGDRGYVEQAVEDLARPPAHRGAGT